MEHKNKTQRIVLTALLTALTCIATMVIQIPTPSLGYIHMGDTFVVLSGVLLGPLFGAFAAGFGSMLADIFSGYIIYAIPTLLIKAFSGFLAGFLFRKIQQKSHLPILSNFILCGIIAELNIVIGYFINSIIQSLLVNTSLSSTTFVAGITVALTGIIPNCIQGITGIVLSLALFPLLIKVPLIRNFIYEKSAS